MANFKIINEVMINKGSGYKLCLHYGQYNYDDHLPEVGYRFIWRKPNGNLQPARGQARIPDANDLYELISKAVAGGWLLEKTI